VSETSVGSDLLQSLQIFSELGIKGVGDELSPGSLTNVSLSVQEPLGNVVVGWLGKNVIDLFDVWFSQLTSSIIIKGFGLAGFYVRGRVRELPFVEIDLSDLEDKVGESSTDTLDGSESEHHLAFTFNVGVLNSENVSELLSLDQLDRWL
jgi:hypothetical protein